MADFIHNPLAPGGTATQEFPPRAAQWQRLRSIFQYQCELYIENRKPGEFVLYIFVGITCGNAAASHAPTELQSISKFPKATVSRWGGE
jgi:hypothetical protein